MVKASNGGGGRGMRVVYNEKDLALEYETACSESKKAFGKAVIFIEKYGFELPYQITKFKNKEELKSYMVDRLKTSITGESQTYEPVVMENDKLM